MVRLVFRPYTQIWRSICTSEPLRASTRVSSGFTLFRHSSPSFGSQQLCSYSNPSEDIRIGRWCTLKGSHLRSLSLRVWVWHPNTRIDVRLLGPCFKTGQWKLFRQNLEYCIELASSAIYFSMRTILSSNTNNTSGTSSQDLVARTVWTSVQLMIALTRMNPQAETFRLISELAFSHGSNWFWLI